MVDDSLLFFAENLQQSFVCLHMTRLIEICMYSQNILGWEEKSKQPITAFFDFANLPCPDGETLKGWANTIIDPQSNPLQIS